MKDYILRCPVCHKTYSDTYLLSCPDGCQGLLRAEYPSKKLIVPDIPGIFKYSDWLPVIGSIPTRAEPICYKSSGLAAELGLSNLWIVFSGYWPEKGAYTVSGSFKEFEAFPTVQRLKERGLGIIQVSSAGNTGRAFAEVSAETGYPVVIVVPEAAKDRIWTTCPGKDILLITVIGDYTDAITLGNQICTIPGIYPEGGAKNIARRDGMGTVMLAGTLTIGRLPDWYIQAVGSGTGGIAAYEAALRLINDGRFGISLPRLLLIQNEPFTPMVRAWNERRRNLTSDDMPDAKLAISKVYSDVLTNRAPPYEIVGGVYDTLMATNGCMDGVTSAASREAGEMCARCEGIDPDPAAAVCIAGLIKSVKSGHIHPDEVILLNITGGGYKRVESELKRFAKQPDLMVSERTSFEMLSESIKTWMKSYA